MIAGRKCLSGLASAASTEGYMRLFKRFRLRWFNDAPGNRIAHIPSHLNRNNRSLPIEIGDGVCKNEQRFLP